MITPRKKIPCVYCKENLASDENGIWPFCSHRCKTMDLAKWAAEQYRVEGKEDDENDNEGDGGAPEEDETEEDDTAD